MKILNMYTGCLCIYFSWVTIHKNSQGQRNGQRMNRVLYLICLFSRFIMVKLKGQMCYAGNNIMCK